jgi:hypothetical protein
VPVWHSSFAIKVFPRPTPSVAASMPGNGSAALLSLAQFADACSGIRENSGGLHRNSHEFRYSHMRNALANRNRLFKEPQNPLGFAHYNRRAEKASASSRPRAGMTIRVRASRQDAAGWLVYLTPRASLWCAVKRIRLAISHGRDE